MTEAQVSITKGIVRFCRFLRANSFPIGILQTKDALRAAQLVSVTDRAAVKDALRSILCSSPEECESFDRLFEMFWNPAVPFEATVTATAVLSRRTAALEGRTSRSVSSEIQLSDIATSQRTGASAVERLKRTDFTTLAAGDLLLLEAIAHRLWRQMSLRVMRRWRLSGDNGRLDLRRTIRHSVARGGEPLDLLWKGKKRKKIQLVTLLDVSGSMDLYSAFLLRFLYALHKYFRRTDSFVFSTRLTPVSRELHSLHLSAVLAGLSESVHDWSGGTRIGECIRDFNRAHGRRLLTRNTLVIILSDGWDTGSPEMLANELHWMKMRAKKIIWLNPLLGLRDYQPVTRGMAAALPLADVFAPAHNMQSLLDLEKHLI